MSITEAKKVISEKLGWKVYDIYYVCADENMFTYYLVYKNHRIKNLVAIDNLYGMVTGIWE